MANREGLPDVVSALIALGFSQLEAEVYSLLVGKKSATGYRLAQELGKAAAGVYKAIDGLVLRGAVIVDDDGARTCRAVDPKELLGQVDRDYAQRRQGAEQALTRLEVPDDDERVYRLTQFDQVIERAILLIETAREIVLVDVFPRCVELVGPALEAATARGIEVHVKLYMPAELNVTSTVVTPDGERLQTDWKGDWLNVVRDAEEHLLALIDCERRIVHQATYSNSTYLSVLQHSAMTCEIELDALNAGIDGGASLEKLRAIRKRHAETLDTFRPRGVVNLRARLASKKSSGSK